KSIDITSEFLSTMNEKLVEKHVRHHDIILRQGHCCTHTCFVPKGLLRAYTIDERGKEHVLQFAPENWLISDRSSILVQDNSEQYIDAVEDAVIVLMKEAFFEKVSAMSPSSRTYTLFALNNHIRHLHKRINL